MKTITVASQKGGAGKTTLTLHLGTLAQQDGPTLLVDADPQGSLAFWFERREAERPLVIPIGPERLGDVLETAKGEGIKFCLIDTAPHDTAGMATAMRLADLVLIPARPSALDLHAIGPTVRMAEALKKPALVVLTQTPPRRGFGEPTAIREARELVEGIGATVALAVIGARAVAAQSVIAGLSVGELEPSGASAAEFAELWNEIRGML